jgi:ATP-grasp domain, R2K clade family 3
VTIPTIREVLLDAVRPRRKLVLLDYYPEHMRDVFEQIEQICAPSGDYDVALARDGFRAATRVEEGCSRSCVVVDGIDGTRRRLAENGIRPVEMNYPECLREFYGRHIESTTYGELLQRTGRWFVKRPYKGSFEPFVFDAPLLDAIMREEAPLCLAWWDESDHETELLVSEPVTFISEWRAFIARGELLDIRPYAGDSFVVPDQVVVVAAIAEHQKHGAPAGYGIDFGVLDDGRTVIVEVNDGFALGSYGLSPVCYAYLIACRWLELWDSAQSDLC